MSRLVHQLLHQAVSFSKVCPGSHFDGLVSQVRHTQSRAHSIMSQGQYSQLFDTQAAEYAQFRPSYPTELFQRILEFAGSEPREHALDCATGSGQAAAELAKYYKRVTASDQSAKQLQQAVQASNVEYRQGKAEDTGLLDGSVNLITVAQALHWFDLPAFYAEARRVLRPGGTLAIWGYDRPFIDSDDKADALVLKLYEGTLGSYWDARRHHIDEHLRGLEPPVQDWEASVRQEFNMHKTMSLQQFHGYLTSWSAYNSFKKQHSKEPDPLEAFGTELAGLLGARDASYSMSIRFPIFLLLARRP